MNVHLVSILNTMRKCIKTGKFVFVDINFITYEFCN